MNFKPLPIHSLNTERVFLELFLQFSLHQQYEVQGTPKFLQRANAVSWHVSKVSLSIQLLRLMEISKIDK